MRGCRGGDGDLGRWASREGGRERGKEGGEHSALGRAILVRSHHHHYRRRRMTAGASADAANRSVEDSRGRTEDRDGLAGHRQRCGRLRCCRWHMILEVRCAGRGFESERGSGGHPH